MSHPWASARHARLAVSGLGPLLTSVRGTACVSLPIVADVVPTFAVIGLSMLSNVPAVRMTRSITRADLPVVTSPVRRG